MHSRDSVIHALSAFLLICLVTTMCPSQSLMYERGSDLKTEREIKAICKSTFIIEMYVLRCNQLVAEYRKRHKKKESKENVI